MNSKTHIHSRRTAGPEMAGLFGGAILAAVVVIGCSHRPIVVQSPAPTVINQSSPAPAPTNTIVMKEAPPPPREEPPPPPAPSTGYVWIHGYWGVSDGRQAWVAGHWDMPPRPTQTWVPARWEQQGDGYVFIPGHWE